MLERHWNLKLISLYFEAPAVSELCLIILSHDPGTSSYGWCVNQYEPEGFKVLEVGMMHHRVSAIHEGLNEASAAYLEEVDGIVRRNGVTHMCFERFQARNAGLYNIIECVNLMMGVLIGNYRTMTFDAFYASVWKNSVNRRLEDQFGFKLDVPPAKLPPLTKEMKAKIGPEESAKIQAERTRLTKERSALPSGYRNLFPQVPDHMVDAFFINVCGWYRKTGKKPFEGLLAPWFEAAGRMVCA